MPFLACLSLRACKTPANGPKGFPGPQGPECPEAAGGPKKPRRRPLRSWGTLPLLADVLFSGAITTGNGRSVDYQDHCTVVLLIHDHANCSLLQRMATESHVSVAQTSPVLSQLEPSGTKQEPSQSAANSACCVSWSQARVLQKASQSQLEPSGAKQEPSQSAVNNTSNASWNQVEPSGTKRGTKRNRITS